MCVKGHFKSYAKTKVYYQSYMLSLRANVYYLFRLFYWRLLHLAPIVIRLDVAVLLDVLSLLGGLVPLLNDGLEIRVLVGRFPRLELEGTAVDVEAAVGSGHVLGDNLVVDLKTWDR